MKQVNMHEAKTNLSRLVEEVVNGEEVVIARAGKPVAKLVAVHEPRLPRTPGGWKGKVWMADEFDEFDAEIEEMFYGRPAGDE